MQRIVETDNGGYALLLGKPIVLFCNIYIYTGTLTGVNDDHLELAKPKLVYETGPLMEPEWQDAQDLPSPWRVNKCSIESWGPAPC
jgi:hypothetical protein